MTLSTPQTINLYRGWFGDLYGETVLINMAEDAEEFDFENCKRVFVTSNRACWDPSSNPTLVSRNRPILNPIIRYATEKGFDVKNVDDVADLTSDDRGKRLIEFICDKKVDVTDVEYGVNCLYDKFWSYMAELSFQHAWDVIKVIVTTFQTRFIILDGECRLFGFNIIKYSLENQLYFIAEVSKFKEQNDDDDDDFNDDDFDDEKEIIELPKLTMNSDFADYPKGVFSLIYDSLQCYVSMSDIPNIKKIKLIFNDEVKDPTLALIEFVTSSSYGVDYPLPIIIPNISCNFYKAEKRFRVLQGYLHGNESGFEDNNNVTNYPKNWFRHIKYQKNAFEDKSTFASGLAKLPKYITNHLDVFKSELRYDYMRNIKPAPKYTL